MTVETLLIEREGTHGSFSNNGRISQALKNRVHSGPNWGQLSDVEREALDMICSKISRIVSGKLRFADNWRDIIGYATLALEVCDADEK